MKNVRMGFVALVAVVALLWSGMGMVGVASDIDLSGNRFITSNDTFWNVIGSTNDNLPRGYTSWINLWATVTPQSVPTSCIVKNCSNPFSGEVGGHIVFDSSYVKPKKAGIDAVYIFPICKSCNHYRRLNGMTIQDNASFTAVKLKNYCLHNRCE